MSIIEEKAIVEKYIEGFPWLMVIWGVGAPLLWLALWPLTSLGIIPIWAGGIVSIFILCFSYFPVHEAQHGNIGRPNSRWRWLNELVGYASAFAISLPYRLHRIMHLKHHAYTNSSEKDPDIYIRADNIWQAIKIAYMCLQPKHPNCVNMKLLEDTPENKKIALEAFIIIRITWLIMAILAWNGFALGLLVLWWIPKQIARMYIPIVCTWLPHYPMQETGRYRETRGWKSKVGTILTGAQEYHLVHHLFPSIPLNRTPAAYRELKPLLEAEGMTLNNL
jgi:fatty acid desaturase